MSDVLEESDLAAIEGLLRYIRDKGYTPRHPFDERPPPGTYDKVARTAANIDEAITKLTHRRLRSD